MIICGDIALPYTKSVEILDIPVRLKNQPWIGNLEGSLIDANDPTRDSLLRQRKVFNDYKAIKDLCADLPFCAFGIANNHIKDAADIGVTTANLIRLNKDFFGAGENIYQAANTIRVNDNGNEYVLIAFGWKFIKCIYANNNKEGVNPYEKKYVLQQIEKVIKDNDGKRVIAFFHWNTELEQYPQPLDRELSHRLIDLGVFAVVGCHAHRIQPIEIYKGHLIAYGLGNFAFPHNVYFNKRLRFPDFSHTEYIVEFTQDGFRVHELEFCPETAVLKYKAQCDESIIASFNYYDNNGYKKFFKGNRSQRKILPILYFEDSRLRYSLKYLWVKTRGKVVELLFKNKTLFNTVKSIVSKATD